MAAMMIPDELLAADAERVTIWIASRPGPCDVWTFKQAIEWAMAQPDRETLSLFRPPGQGESAAWVMPDQIARLAARLMPQRTPEAA